VLRGGNNNFTASLDRPETPEYTVNMTSTANSSGCVECGRRAAGNGGDSTFGTWQDLERAVKGNRHGIEREVKEEKGKILHKVEHAAIQGALQNFAHKLKVIDDEYYKCKEASTIPKEKAVCDPNARDSIGKLVKNLEALPTINRKMIDDLNGYLVLVKYTEYPVVKKNVIYLIWFRRCIYRGDC
jgi:hypothetical protein